MRTGPGTTSTTHHPTFYFAEDWLNAHERDQVLPTTCTPSNLAICTALRIIRTHPRRHPHVALPRISEGLRQASDHRFVYIGPKGTFTPLHKDTLCR